MKLKRKINSILILFFALVQTVVYSQPAIGNEGYNVIKEAYTYDKSLPLSVVMDETTKLSLYTRYAFHYTGAKERIRAYLAIPNNGKEPFPLVLLIDGMGGSAERWFEYGNWPNGLETVEALVEKGFAVFTIDATNHGERFQEQDVFPKPLELRKEDLMHTVRDMIKETVQDYMRGLDFLETREDININKVGVYGLSMGGTITFILTGLDSRIKTAIAGVAVVYGNEYSLVNAYNFTSRIKTKPVLMLMGDNDGYYTPKTASQLFHSIGGANNKLIIFEGRHKVPVGIVPTIATWFNTQLIATD